MLRVVLTNDDGIQAPGISCLARRLAQRCEVTVVAPSTPSSATSHAITLHKPLRLIPADHYGYEDEDGTGRLRAFHCSGTPSDCVMLGVLHLHNGNPPDLVISGINDGVNVAQDLTYSGTVGGALEGAMLGIPSLAISLDWKKEGADFENAAAVAEAVISIMCYGRLPSAWTGRLGNSTVESPGEWKIPAQEFDPGQVFPSPGRWWPEAVGETPCLNINLPDLPPEQIKGINWTFSGKREYTDIIQRKQDPRGRPYYWIGGEKILADLDKPGCDTWALRQNRISVTPMTCDITSYEHLALFKQTGGGPGT